MNKKAVVGALVGAAVLLGGVGAGTVVSASAAGEIVYAENSYVYTEEQKLTYEEGMQYELDVYLSTTVAIASFQMDFHMPYFTEIVEVRETLGDMSYIHVMDEDMNSFTINGVSSMDRMDGRLFTVVYTLREGASGSETPYGEMQQCTNTEYNYVEGIYVECAPITIEEVQEDARLKGDMNEDGVISLEDLLIVQRSLIDPYASLSEVQTVYADINGDGAVDLLDCQYIQMYIVGRLDSLENVGGSDDSEGGDVAVNTIQVKVQLQVDGTVMEENNVMEVTEGTTAAVLIDTYKNYNGIDYSVTVCSDGNYLKEVTAETVLSAGRTYYLSLESVTTDPVVPVENVASYTLVIDGQVVGDYTLAFSEGDAVVKFMETYKVYNNVAYSEIFVYTYTDDGSMVELTSDTLLTADAHYRVVLTGGTQLGGETDTKMNVFVQLMIDGALQGVEAKDVNVGDTLKVLREAYAADGYTVSIFSDESYSVEISEAEAEATLLESEKTYYISLISIASTEPVEPTQSLIYLTVVTGEEEEDATLTISEGDTVVTLMETYKVYNGVAYSEIFVYTYTDDGAMVELTSDTLLTAGSSYRVELVGGSENASGDESSIYGVYTRAENVEETLVLNGDGSFEFTYEGKVKSGSEYTWTQNEESGRVNVALYTDEGVAYYAELNLVDLTFTM